MTIVIADMTATTTFTLEGLQDLLLLRAIARRIGASLRLAAPQPRVVVDRMSLKGTPAMEPRAPRRGFSCVWQVKATLRLCPSRPKRRQAMNAKNRPKTMKVYVDIPNNRPREERQPHYGQDNP